MPNRDEATVEVAYYGYEPIIVPHPPRRKNMTPGKVFIESTVVGPWTKAFKEILTTRADGSHTTVMPQVSVQSVTSLFNDRKIECGVFVNLEIDALVMEHGKKTVVAADIADKLVDGNVFRIARGEPEARTYDEMMDEVDVLTAERKRRLAENPDALKTPPPVAPEGDPMITPQVGEAPAAPGNPLDIQAHHEAIPPVPVPEHPPAVPPQAIPPQTPPSAPGDDGEM